MTLKVVPKVVFIARLTNHADMAKPLRPRNCSPATYIPSQLVTAQPKSKKILHALAG